MLWIWIALIVVFVIVEIATVQLVTVWFAIGSVAGLIAYAFKLDIWSLPLVFSALCCKNRWVTIKIKELLTAISSVGSSFILFVFYSSKEPLPMSNQNSTPPSAFLTPHCSECASCMPLTIESPSPK